MSGKIPLDPATMAVGQVHRLITGPVTTAQLVRYAGASGDYNPIHYDLPHAQSAGLGGVIAHGMLTMAFAGRCVGDWAGTALWVQELGGRFLTPVRPGQQVAMTATITELAEGGAQIAIEGHVEAVQVFTGHARLAPRAALAAA